MAGCLNSVIREWYCETTWGSETYRTIAFGCENVTGADIPDLRGISTGQRAPVRCLHAGAPWLGGSCQRESLGTKGIAAAAMTAART